MKIFYFITLILGSLLAIFSQDLAYFFNNFLPDVHVIYFLSLICGLVFILFFVNFYLVFKKVAFKNMFLARLLSLGLGLPLLFFNFIILVAWWG